MFIIKHERDIDRCGNWLPGLSGIRLKLSVCQEQAGANNRDQSGTRSLSLFDDGSLMKLSNILITNENMCGCRRLHGRMRRCPFTGAGFGLTKGCGQPWQRQPCYCCCPHLLVYCDAVANDVATTYDVVADDIMLQARASASVTHILTPPSPLPLLNYSCCISHTACSSFSKIQKSLYI